MSKATGEIQMRGIARNMGVIRLSSNYLPYLQNEFKRTFTLFIKNESISALESAKMELIQATFCNIQSKCLGARIGRHQCSLCGNQYFC